MTNDDIPEIDRLYALEIRQMGVNLPERIPDCAWVPRVSMQAKVAPAASSAPMKPAGMSWSIPLEIYFTEPFHWVEATFIATKKDKE